MLAALAREAVQQIRERNYVAACKPGVGIKLAGVVFDPVTRTVAEGGVLVEDG